MIPYVQKQYSWIPRLFYEDPETGTYANFPAGGWQWISDQDPNTIPFDPAPGLQQRAMHLPDWFPRKVYISSVIVASNSAGPNGTVSEFAAWIDPGGQFFLSGNPHGAEGGSNFTKFQSLFHMTWSEQSPRREFPLERPVLLDRDAGDLIGAKAGLSFPISNIFIGFRYLVQNPYPELP